MDDDAPRPSRYAWFRRKLGPVAVVIALVVLVRQTMSKHDVERGTIELRFGAHAGEVSHVRALVLDDGAPVGHMERDLRADPATPIRFPAELSAHTRIVVDLSTAAGPRRFEHAVPRADGDVVVDLGPDLDAATRE